MQLPLPAFIPDDYVPDVHQRLFFYKRLAQAATDEELYDAQGRDARSATAIRPTRWTRWWR